MAFAAGGTMVLSYTNGTERWEVRIPLAEFDPATFLYTGAGLKVPTEAGVGQTFSAFGSYWAAYFDASWALTIEAVFWTSGGMGRRLATVPTAVSIAGTSATPSSTAPPIQRGFTFQLDNGERHVLRLFGIATDLMGARRAVSPSAGGFDARDQALMGYLAGPATGLVAWDGQVFPPTAFVYQRYKLRPFNLPGPAGPAGPPGANAILPYGVTGDLLVNVGSAWVRLPAGAVGQRLTMDLHGSAALPTWLDDCCAATGKVITPLPPSGQQVAAQRCGAAVQMAAYLILYYNKVRTLLNAAGSATLILTLPLLADLILGAAPSLLTAGTLLSARQILRLLVALSLRGLSVSVAPPLTTAMQAAIRQAIYCALPLPPDPLDVTDTVRAQWCAALTANPVFTQLAGPILALLSEIVTLAGWQTLANLGAQAPQTICTTCGAGAAMQGGAQFAVGLTRAMQGGAQFGVHLTRAMQGGAQFGAALTGSMQGGAARP